MTKPTLREAMLLQQAQKDLQALAAREPVVNFAVDVPTIFNLIGQLQLALRHPSNRGRSAVVCAKMVSVLADQVAKTEALRWLINAGSDPRHDLTIVLEGKQLAVRPTVVALIGHHVHDDVWLAAAENEERCGRLVLLPVLSCLLVDGPPTQEETDMLRELTLRRIDLADEVLVMDFAGFGEPAQVLGLNYARAHQKRVRFWSEESNRGTDANPAYEEGGN